MDLPRYRALLTYWEQFPPVHISMAAYVGWGKAKGNSADAGDVDSLMDTLPTAPPVGAGGR